MNLVEKSHEIVLEFLSREKNANFAIDATLGNGKDALFLARSLAQMREKKITLFGFDVQNSAIENSTSLLKNANFEEKKDFHFFQRSHEDMKTFLEKKFENENIFSNGKGIIMFNLGWLPNSDKTTITQSESTLNALNNSLEILLKTSGLLSVLSYRAHEGGSEEYLKVKDFFESKKLPKGFKTFGNSDNAASPILFTSEI